MFIKIGILSLAIAFSLFAVAGVVVQKTGLLIVDVQDRDGHIFLPIPMLLVNADLSFAPVADRISLPDQIQDHSVLMQAAAKELMACPDGPFVEVNSQNATVLVAKQGTNMIVDVKSDDKKVYVQIPIQATGKTLAKLASLEIE